MAVNDKTWLLHIHDWDVRVFQRWQERSHRAQIMRVARQVSASADGWPYPVFALLCYLIMPEQGAALMVLMAWAFLIERSVYLVLKNSFRRRRPPAAIPNFRSVIIASDEFSMPSGHTSGAFVFITCCYLVFGSFVWPAYLWALAVAISRVSLGVHFPTDTVLGALMGSSIAWFSFAYLV